MENFEQYEENKTDKSSILIKIILPVISILIVLVGLIVLYQVGNVDQYVTNEMRIGFGYTLSFGLLGGYIFEKVRSTVFAQIVLSGTLSALTLTTIIATHGYKIFPYFIGLGILGILFLIGLLLAKEHTSEIEFSTSALIGLSIPFFYTLDSFFVILLLEIIVVGSLYLFLIFFEKIRFLHILVLILHAVLAFVIILQYSVIFSPEKSGYDWVLNIYEVLQLSLLFIPFFYLRRKFLSDENFQIIVVLTTTFCMALSTSFIFIQVQNETAIRLHFAVVYSAIALILLFQALMLREEGNSQLLHILSFIVLTIGFFIFFKIFIFKFAAMLTIIFLHIWLLNSVFKTEDGNNKWNKILNILFCTLGIVLGLSLIINIMAFVLRIPIVESNAFYERFIPPTVLVLNYWLAYFFVIPKRTFSFQREFIFSLAWVFTALYFLYIPWQFMQFTLNGNPTIQLILLSVLWGVAAYVSTILGMKHAKIGLRIFTLIIAIFLIIKYILVDVPVFLEHQKAFTLSLYTIFFGVALLVLSALLIKEITKNGSLKAEWLMLKRAFVIQRKESRPVVIPTMTRFLNDEVSKEEQFSQLQSNYLFQETSLTQPTLLNQSVPQPYSNISPVPEVSNLSFDNEVKQANVIEMVGTNVSQNQSNDIVSQNRESQQQIHHDSSIDESKDVQIGHLIALLEEQRKFNENHIKVQEMQFETQQMYIESQKQMNEQMNEMLEKIRSLGNNKEAN